MWADIMSFNQEDEGVCLANARDLERSWLNTVQTRESVLRRIPRALAFHLLLRASRIQTHSKPLIDNASFAKCVLLCADLCEHVLVKLVLYFASNHLNVREAR